jgi:DNA-binding NarL/FixJ family response regulator
MMQSSSEVLSAPVSVYLLAENRLLRETLAHLLAKREGLSIAGVSRYTESTVEEICASGCAILRMDSLATKQATTLLADLSERDAGIDLILFGMGEEIDLFVRSAHLEVSGYVLQEAPASEIVAAVLAVARGEAAWPPRLCMALGRHLSRECRNRPRFSMLAGGVKYCLTRRQLELIRLMERGLTNKEIATKLNLSEFTVKNHLRRIMKEVDADDRHEAVDAIRASGLLPVV